MCVCVCVFVYLIGVFKNNVLPKFGRRVIHEKSEKLHSKTNNAQSTHHCLISFSETVSNKTQKIKYCQILVHGL